MKINKISSEKEILSDFYKIAGKSPSRKKPIPKNIPGFEATPPASSAAPTPEAPKPAEPEVPVTSKAPNESGSGKNTNIPSAQATSSKILQNLEKDLEVPLDEVIRYEKLLVDSAGLSNHDRQLLFIKSTFQIDILGALNKIKSLGGLNWGDQKIYYNFISRMFMVASQSVGNKPFKFDQQIIGPYKDKFFGNGPTQQQVFQSVVDELNRLSELVAKNVSDYDNTHRIKVVKILYNLENDISYMPEMKKSIEKSIDGISDSISPDEFEKYFNKKLGEVDLNNPQSYSAEYFLSDISKYIQKGPSTSGALPNAPSAKRVAPPKPVDLPSTPNDLGMPDDVAKAAENAIQSTNPERAIDIVIEQAANPQAAKAAADAGSEIAQEAAQKTKTVKDAAEVAADAINTAATSGNLAQLDNAVGAAASVASDTSAQVTGMQAMLASARAAAPTPTITPPVSQPRVPPTLPPSTSLNLPVSSGGKRQSQAPASSPTPANPAKPASSAAPISQAPTPQAAPLPAATPPVSSALPQATQAVPPASAAPTPTPPAAAVSQTPISPGSTQAPVSPAAQAAATATAAQTAAANTASQAQAATAKVSRLKKLYDTTKDFAQKSRIAKAIGSATVWAATLAAKTAVFLGICYGSYSLYNYLLKDEAELVGEDFLSGASTQLGELSDNRSLLAGAPLDPLNLDENIGGRAGRAIQKAKSLIESGEEAAADILLNRVAKVYDASGYHKLSPEVSAALSAWTSSDIKYVFPRKSLGARSPLDKARALATEKKILDILTNSNKTNDAVKGRIINDSGTSDGQQIANYMFSTIANKGLFTGGIGGNRRVRRWSKGKELDSRENLGFSGSRDRKLTRQERKEQRAMGKSDVIDSADDPFSIFSAAEKEFLEKNSSNYNKSTNFNNINKKADKISDGYFKDAIKDLDNDAQIKEYYIAYSELYDAKVEKKPQTFKDLYKVPSKDLTNKAHPKSVVLSDAKGNGGLIENGDEAQKAIIDVVTRNPTGFNNHRYAFIRNALKKI